MNIKTVSVTSENVMEVITNPKVHIIKKRWADQGYTMKPIADADVKDLLTNDVVIIEIVE